MSNNDQYNYAAFKGDNRYRQTQPNSTSGLVGAGMIGSSLAYHLSVRGVNVTVLDQRTNLLPSDDGSYKDHDIDPGTATSASFA